MKFFIDFLIVLWIATIGAEKVNFFPELAFKVTPFITLSSVLIIFIVIDFIYKGKVVLTKNFKQYLLFVSMFAIISLVSVFFSLETIISLSRWCLLVFQVFTTAIVVLYMSKSHNTKKVLLNGLYLGLLINFVFDIIQLLQFSNNINVIEMLNLDSIISTDIKTMGYLFLRPSGVSEDMNRGAMLLGVYLFLLYYYYGNFRYKTIITIVTLIALFFSLSRSAIISVFIAFLFLQIHNKHYKAKHLIKYTLVFFIAIVLIINLLGLLNIDSTILESLLAERSSFSSDTSAGIHLDLIKDGIDLVLTDLKIFVSGIGFGNSFKVLTEYYGDNKYGNFHSVYITVLVETGIFSFLCFMYIIIYPILRKMSIYPLVLGIAAFNVFYLLILEPYFWFITALSWSGLSKQVMDNLGGKTVK